MLKRQFLRFITVGLLTTTISYGIFLITMNLLAWNYLLASAFGFVIGLFIGFFCNKNWTFSSKGQRSRELIYKYFLVYFASLLISLIFLKISVDGIGIIPEIANILAIGITTCTNFIGIKIFVFDPIRIRA